jgi:hypothetical protein
MSVGKPTDFRWMKAIPGIDLRTKNKLAGWPPFPVANLTDDKAWNAFTEFTRCVLERA